MAAAVVIASEDVADKLCMLSNQRSPGCVPACIGHNKHIAIVLFSQGNDMLLAVAAREEDSNGTGGR